MQTLIKRLSIVILLMFVVTYAYAADKLMSQESQTNARACFTDTGNNYGAAQSFQNAKAFTLEYVVIWTGASVGTPTNPTITIETNSGSIPSGVLAHANGTKTQAMAASSWVTVDYTDFDLAASTVYWLTWTHTNVATNGHRWYTDSTAPYADGNAAWSAGGVWAAQVGWDQAFQVWGTEASAGGAAQTICITGGGW